MDGALGITDGVYRLVSVTGGTLAGATMLAGLVLLVARRVVQESIRQTTTAMDVVMYVVLGFVVLIGIWATVGVKRPRLWARLPGDGGGRSGWHVPLSPLPALFSVAIWGGDAAWAVPRKRQ